MNIDLGKKGIYHQRPPKISKEDTDLSSCRQDLIEQPFLNENPYN